MKNGNGQRRTRSAHVKKKREDNSMGISNS